MYMSYCRFEGTRHELNACLGDVLEHVNEEAEYAVSDKEIAHFKEMTRDFVNFLWDIGVIEAYIDDEALDQVCEKMKKSYAEEDEYDA